MRELCLACAGFALEFIVFYAAGIVLVRILKVKGDCSLTFILGDRTDDTEMGIPDSCGLYMGRNHGSGYLRSCDLHNKKTTENTCRTNGNMQWNFWKHF